LAIYAAKNACSYAKTNHENNACQRKMRFLAKKSSLPELTLNRLPGNRYSNHKTHYAPTSFLKSPQSAYYNTTCNRFSLRKHEKALIIERTTNPKGGSN